MCSPAGSAVQKTDRPNLFPQAPQRQSVADARSSERLQPPLSAAAEQALARQQAATGAPARPAPLPPPAATSAAQVQVRQQPAQQQRQQQQQQQLSSCRQSHELKPQAAPWPPAGGSGAVPHAAVAAPPACEPLQQAVAQLASDPHAEAAAEVLARLLRNVLGSPGEAKFRRVRLANPRIQAAVVDTHGGVETLLAAGFEIVFEEAAQEDGSFGSDGQGGAAAEGYAVLAPGAPLEPLQQALTLLAPLLPAPASAGLGAAASEPSRASKSAAVVEASPQRELLAAGSGGASSVAASAATAAPQQAQRWDPPRERSTQVRCEACAAATQPRQTPCSRLQSPQSPVPATCARRRRCCCLPHPAMCLTGSF